MYSGLSGFKTISCSGKYAPCCVTSAQVVETSVNVTSNSPSQHYTHPDDHNLPNYNTKLLRALCV